MLNVMWGKQITGDWRECGRFSIDSYYGNCRSEEAFVAIRSGVMAGVFTDYAKLLRLFLVFHLIGDVFLALLKLSNVVKRFVYREGSSDSSGDSSQVDTATLVAQAQSLIQQYQELQEPANKQFKDFHDFSISCGLPLASVLISDRKSCRKCGKALIVE